MDDYSSLLTDLWGGWGGGGWGHCRRQKPCLQTDGRTDVHADVQLCELTRLKSLDSVLWSLRFLTGDLALSLRGEDAWREREGGREGWS